MTSQVGPSKLGEEVEEGVFEVGEEVFKVGEGLFAAIDLPKATTVCLYSGLTMTKVGEHVKHVKIQLTKDKQYVDLTDVPMVHFL